MTPATPRSQTADALIRALANAHRWNRMLEAGDCASIGHLAAVERVNPSYLRRIPRLTLLAPDIVQAILDGLQPATLRLERLLKPMPPMWSEQLDELLAVR